MIHILGAALVAAGCALIGARRGQELQCRVQSLEALLAGFGQMRRELELHLTPLPQLMTQLSHTADAPARELFAGCESALKDLEGRPFSQAWRELCGRIPALQDEDRRLLYPLGKILGKCPAPAQSAAIGESCRALEEQCRLAREDYRRKGKVCRALGAAAGGFLAILLL